jgi:hypothetical protein
VSARPALDAFLRFSPGFNNIAVVDVGVEAKWRLYAVSPSVRAMWRNRGGDNGFVLGAGLELGGIWALCHHE